MVLPESARSILESDALAHLVTINRDGSPQVTCIWVGLDGDEIVSGHLFLQQKLRNVGRDPRVTLSPEGEASNEIGMRHEWTRRKLVRARDLAPLQAARLPAVCRHAGSLNLSARMSILPRPVPSRRTGRAPVQIAAYWGHDCSLESGSWCP